MSTIMSLAEDRVAALDKAAEILESGSVVVLPVGGVYAVVADAFRAAATQRIFAARRRSRVTPLPVLLRTERQVGGLAGDVPEWADRLIAAYWPGDLTLILPVSQDLGWDLGNSKGTVQLRLPQDELVRDLVGRIGPLACTAANRLGQDRPRTVDAAKAQLGVLVPLYLDGGELDGRVSTIVDCTGPSPVVHREGVVSEEDVHVVAAGELEWGERPQPPAPAVLADADPLAPADADPQAPADADPQAPADADAAVEADVDADVGPDETVSEAGDPGDASGEAVPEAGGPDGAAREGAGRDGAAPDEAAIEAVVIEAAPTDEVDGASIVEGAEIPDREGEQDAAAESVDDGGASIVDSGAEGGTAGEGDRGGPEPDGAEEQPAD